MCWWDDGVYRGIGMVGAEEEVVQDRRGLLYSKITALATRYNRVRKGVPAMAAVASILQDPCEKRIEHDIAIPPVREVRFDPLYSELHSFVVSRVLDHVRSRLREEGLPAALSREAQVPLGHYDVLLQSGMPCRVLAHGVEVLKVEVKTAQSLPLAEATRYIWASDAPLLIARFLTGQMTVLRPERLQEYVHFTLDETIRKADRILARDIQAIPGPYCSSCPLSECEWNDKKDQARDNRIITMRDFEADFAAVLGNLPVLAGKIGNIAVEEVKSMQSSPQQIPANSTGVRQVSGEVA